MRTTPRCVCVCVCVSENATKRVLENENETCMCVQEINEEELQQMMQEVRACGWAVGYYLRVLP